MYKCWIKVYNFTVMKANAGPPVATDDTGKPVTSKSIEISLKY